MILKMGYNRSPNLAAISATTPKTGAARKKLKSKLPGIQGKWLTRAMANRYPISKIYKVALQSLIAPLTTAVVSDRPFAWVAVWKQVLVI